MFRFISFIVVCLAIPAAHASDACLGYCAMIRANCLNQEVPQPIHPMGFAFNTAEFEGPNACATSLFTGGLLLRTTCRAGGDQCEVACAPSARSATDPAKPLANRQLRHPLHQGETTLVARPLLGPP